MKTLLVTLAIIVMVGTLAIMGAAVIQTWTVDLTREFLPQIFKMIEVIAGIFALMAFGPNWLKVLASMRKPKEVLPAAPNPIQQSTAQPRDVWSNVEYVEYGKTK